MAFIGRTKLIVLSILKPERAVLVSAVAESIFTLTSPAPFSSRTCIMVLALPGSKMRALRSVLFCSLHAYPPPPPIVLYTFTLLPTTYINALLSL